MLTVTIEQLICHLQQIQSFYPDADIYFTSLSTDNSFELEFCLFNIDAENNNIEMLFTTEN